MNTLVFYLLLQLKLINQINRLDITYLKNAKKGIDVCFKTQMWNLSQNVDRNIEGSKTGICTCLTPTAIPYLTQRGGPMIGLEALSMQGLPVDQLLLTRETEKNLLDLAGNAMSSTVVGTAMIAALIVAKDILCSNQQDFMDTTVDAKERNQAVIGEDQLKLEQLDLGQAKITGMKRLLENANRSSRMCYCEGQTGITENMVQRCRDCGGVACDRCGRSPTHNYKQESSVRLQPLDFEKELKSALPMILRIDSIDNECLEQQLSVTTMDIPAEIRITWLDMANKAFSSHFRFSSLKRQQTWTAYYVAAKASLELHLDSIQPEWRLYAKVPSTEPGNSLRRKLSIEPIARARFITNASNILECDWAICLPGVTSAELTIKGSGDLVSSWEKTLGLLNSEAKEKLVWSKLVIDFSDPSKKILFDRYLGGTWTLLPDCGTATRALHKQDGDSESSLFLFLDPTTTGDVKDDGFVFSSSPRRYLFREKRPIVARLDPKWRPKGGPEADRVTCYFNGHWSAIPSAKFAASAGTSNSISFAIAESSLLQEMSNGACRDAVAFLVAKAQIEYDPLSLWPRHWTEIDQLHAQEIFRSLAWLTEKIKSKNASDKWTELDLNGKLDNCEICSPPPPTLRWQLKGSKFIPMEDPEQAGPYENALKNRPLPWMDMVCLDQNNFLQLKIGINLKTLAHRAINLLPRRDNLGGVTVKWKVVADYVLPTRIVFRPYTIKSNKFDSQKEQPPNFVRNLRREQLRSLTWMVKQEMETAEPFIEEEVVEAYHTHLKLRADAKAQRPNLSQGGVLADEVGYGKTAITLGLIDCTQNNYIPPIDRGKRIPIKATLVVVPPHLPRQWVKEVAKFTGTTYNVVEIRNLQALNNLSIQNMQAADIIIVSCTLFKSSNYLENLAGFAGTPDCPTTEGRRYNHWLDETLAKLAIQIENLQTHGAQAVLDAIKISEAENNNLVQATIAPSKRLKGTALNKATNAKKSANGKKKRRTISSNSDSEEDSDEPPSKVKSTPRKSRAAADPWLLKTKAMKDWRWMKSPPLEIFHFNRIVIDEFTYLKGNIHVGITNLQSKFKWVLSGTPPLGDFADIKSISVFLGIHLGIDDDTVGSKLNNKKIASQRSGECFLPSTSWRHINLILSCGNFPILSSKTHGCMAFE